VTDQQSFENVENWMKDIEEHASEKTLKFLVGNKGDLVARKSVSTQVASILAQKHQMSFLETSAKDNMNVDAVFLAVTEELLATIGTNVRPSSPPSSPPITLSQPQPPPQSRKCC
jgi:GTPase SAR1 family protein